MEAYYPQTDLGRALRAANASNALIEPRTLEVATGGDKYTEAVGFNGLPATIEIKAKAATGANNIEIHVSETASFAVWRQHSDSPMPVDLDTDETMRFSIEPEGKYYRIFNESATDSIYVTRWVVPQPR